MDKSKHLTYFYFMEKIKKDDWIAMNTMIQEIDQTLENHDIRRPLGEELKQLAIQQKIIKAMAEISERYKKLLSFAETLKGKPGIFADLYDHESVGIEKAAGQAESMSSSIAPRLIPSVFPYFASSHWYARGTINAMLYWVEDNEALPVETCDIRAVIEEGKIALVERLHEDADESRLEIEQKGSGPFWASMHEGTLCLLLVNFIRNARKRGGAKKIKILLEGTVKRANVCTSCIQAGKIIKA